MIKHFDTIENFHVAAYKGDINSTIDVTRFDLFASSVTGNLREIPTLQHALQMHVLRSAFPSGWVRRNTLSAENRPVVSELGWNMIPEEDGLTLKWTEHKNIPDHLQLANIIKTCKCDCIRAKCLNCICVKMKYKCLTFCNCKLMSVTADS